jgi:hypothetical protein
VGWLITGELDRVKQQPDGDGVLRVAPAGRDRPQDAGTRGGEQAALPKAHPEFLRERVGGEQGDAAQRDLVRPGEQPDRRVQVVRAGDDERQAERRDQGGAGHQDDRRARQRDQPGGRRVEAADVPVSEPGRRDQRAPQVVGQRPFPPADQRRAPRGREHPDQNEAHRRDQRKHPPPNSLPHPAFLAPLPAPAAARTRRSALRRRSPDLGGPCLVNRVLDYKAPACTVIPLRGVPLQADGVPGAKPVKPRPARPFRRCPATVTIPPRRGPSQVDSGSPDDIGPRGKGDPSRPPPAYRRSRLPSRPPGGSSQL